MSAFDAAAAGEGSRRGVSGGGGGGSEDSLVTVLSQRLWTLAQALEKVEKIVQGVGSAADSPALRARLAAAEAKASALWSEIDAGARKLRVAAASGGGDRAAVERFQGERDMRDELAFPGALFDFRRSAGEERGGKQARMHSRTQICARVFYIIRLFSRPQASTRTRASGCRRRCCRRANGKRRTPCRAATPPPTGTAAAAARARARAWKCRQSRSGPWATSTAPSSRCVRLRAARALLRRARSAAPPPFPHAEPPSPPRPTASLRGAGAAARGGAHCVGGGGGERGV